MGDRNRGRTVIGIEEKPAFVVIFMINVEQPLKDVSGGGRIVLRWYDMHLDAGELEELEILFRGKGVVTGDDEKAVVAQARGIAPERARHAW